MAAVQPLSIRTAGPSDAPQIATLHAESWRRHYRGAYSDFFLDGDLETERLAVWSHRLDRSDADAATFVAEEGDQTVGFVHAMGKADPIWGTLIDNLHVTSCRQRAGIGTQLLATVAQWSAGRYPDSGIHLWVLEQNDRAQAFYRARGGAMSGRELVSPPGGDPRNLEGRVAKLRVAWDSPVALLSPRGPAPAGTEP
jgi:ribosomal protein S18 acetylase RimI-like enzyme